KVYSEWTRISMIGKDLWRGQYDKTPEASSSTQGPTGRKGTPEVEEQPPTYEDVYDMIVDPPDSTEVWKSYIEERYGQEVWAQALQACGVQDDTEFLEFKQHEDKLTHHVMSASIRAAGSSLEASQGLELFGAFFVQFMVRQGCPQCHNTSMVSSSFATSQEFVQNLNDMHHVLERDFRSACFPIFSAFRGHKSLQSPADFGREAGQRSAEVHVELLKTGPVLSHRLTMLHRTCGGPCLLLEVAPSGGLAPAHFGKALAGFSWFDLHKVLAAACRGTDAGRLGGSVASPCLASLWSRRQEAEAAEVVIAAREQDPDSLPSVAKIRLGPG
ncbi:unnamed protein product, partial [Symbiodinium sp. KB8]